MKKKPWHKYITALLSAALVFGAMTLSFYLSDSPEKVTYQEFQKLLSEEQIKQVTMDKTKETLIVHTEDTFYITPNPNHEGFKKELLEAGVDVQIRTSASTGQIISTIVSLLFYILLFSLLFKYLSNATGKNNKIDIPVNIPKTKFHDIAGYEEQKEDLNTYVKYLKNPVAFVNSGAKMPKGVLLYGPPGTGKTLLARGIAGEAGVPFYSVSGSDFIEMFVGVGAKRVRSLFKKARETSPCIIFIDELDAVGGSRDYSGSSSEHRQTLNALLAEMDGFDEDSGVLVLATTNRPGELDNALTRSGRFDSHISVPLPMTSEERRAIIEVHKKNRNFSNDVDFDTISKQWVGFSGADIESVLNEAAIISVQRNLESITKSCVEEAYYKKILKGHVRRKGQQNRKEEELQLVAFHEAGHAITRRLLDNGEVSKVTILSTTSGAGGVTFNIPEKMGLFSMKDLHNEVKTLYAGRAAEYLFNNKEIAKVTTGAQNDIERASQLLYAMVSEYGLQEEPLLINLKKIPNMEAYVFNEMKRISNKLFTETVELLEEHYILLERVAHRLIEVESIESDELNYMIDSYWEEKQTVA